MANLNLSEFTEKTFVADADWVFVWDTANSISKKVSRNSLLNSGTLTTSAPVTISQTWDALAVAFTALKVNAVSTNSAAASLLLDLQVGGVSQFSVTKSGALTALGSAYVGALNVGNGIGLSTAGGHIRASNGIAINLGVSDSTSTDNFANLFLRSSALISFGGNTKLLRDDADNTLALRNGAAAQKFRVYNTYTDASNYERGIFEWASNELNIATVKSGSGLARNILLAADGALKIYTGNATYGWQFTTAGHFFFNADGSSDIGASGGNRPRNVYVANSIVVGASDGVAGSITVGIGASKGIIFGNRGQIGAVGDGVFGFVDFAGTSFSRLQLGPNTDAAPAIARDGAGIKITGAAAGLTSHIKVPAVAVTSLPSAATAGVGARAFVNDALAPVFGSTVANGGAVAVPVYSDGSAWYVG